MDTQTLNEALIRQFPSPQSDAEILDQQNILNLLFELQRNGVDGESILSALENKNLSRHDYAVVAFLDTYLVTAITSAQLPDTVSSQLKGIAVAAARIALSDGMLAMTKSPIIPIADSLLALTFGSTDLQAKSLDSLEEKFQEALQSLHVATGNLVSDQGMINARNRLLALLEADIIDFISNERDKTKKLEKRLIDTVRGQLTAEKSRNLATSLVNEQMENKIIPQPIFDFLRGVWFDSLQLIATRLGEDSEEWRRAVQPSQSGAEPESEFDQLLEEVALDVELEAKLEDEPQIVEPAPEDQPVPIETVSSKTNQQLYRIIEHLPAELKSSLLAIEHDNEAIANALGNIESVHINIMKGEPIEGCDFLLLPVEPSMEDANSRVSQSLLTPVMKLSANSWFVLNAENGTTKHIKLTLKDDDTQHLIFTNRSGSSALQTSFEEFAYLLSSGKVTQLPQPGDLLKNLRRNLMASLKLKVKEDQVVQLRQKREAEESLVEALSGTQFVLLALSKVELENEVDSEIILAKSAVRAAIELAEEATELVFVDQSGFNLDMPGVDEIVKLATGTSVKIEDETPVGMDDFKAAVSRMRKYPKLAAVGEDA